SVGKTQAQELVKDELQRLQPQFQSQWDRNMAAAYAQSISAEGLRIGGSHVAIPLRLELRLQTLQLIFDQFLRLR
ncbi:hypothetical protein QCD79_32625, partial [Pseudomonas quasicaspiana]|nr:hypothetical protein [Pseudomonas quasicaspiana]